MSEVAASRVWVVVHSPAYEGSAYLGVYASEAEAKKHLADIHAHMSKYENKRDYDVERIEVLTAYDPAAGG